MLIRCLTVKIQSVSHRPPGDKSKNIYFILFVIGSCVLSFYCTFNYFHVFGQLTLVFTPIYICPTLRMTMVNNHVNILLPHLMLVNINTDHSESPHPPPVYISQYLEFIQKEGAVSKKKTE